MQSTPLADRAALLARHAAVLLGFSIPISIALDNVLLVAIAVLWLASCDFRRKFEIVCANKVALAALALFGMLAAGLTYGTRDPGDGASCLVKYLDLAFIPIFVTIFRDARARELALRVFCAAMVLSFVAAELNAAGLLRGNPLLDRYPEYPGGFRHSITHGLLAAFAALAFALFARETRRGARRLLFIALAAVAAYNVLLVAISRTAYVSLVVLGVYFVLASIGRRRRLPVLLLLSALLAGAYLASQGIQIRASDAMMEALEWTPGRPAAGSVGGRLEAYRASLPLVRDHPAIGSGTGSFARVYGEAVKGTGLTPIDNPHNEYILVAVQTGLAGLVLLLHLFWRQWRLAPQLSSRLEGNLARGLVLLIATGCLFNSLLLDHTEGLLFAWFTGLLYGGLQSRQPQ